MGRALRWVRALPRRSLAATFGLLILAGFAAVLVARPVVWPYGPETVDAQNLLASP